MKIACIRDNSVKIKKSEEKTQGRGANTSSKKIIRTQKKIEFAYEINKKSANLWQKSSENKRLSYKKRNEIKKQKYKK